VLKRLKRKRDGLCARAIPAGGRVVGPGMASLFSGKLPDRGAEGRAGPSRFRSHAEPKVRTVCPNVSHGISMELAWRYGFLPTFARCPLAEGESRTHRCPASALWDPGGRASAGAETTPTCVAGGLGLTPPPRQAVETTTEQSGHSIPWSRCLLALRPRRGHGAEFSGTSRDERLDGQGGSSTTRP
jgi:hypothetical protein